MVCVIESMFSVFGLPLAKFLPAGENCNAKVFENGIDPQWFGPGEVAGLIAPRGSARWNDGLFQELNQSMIGKLDSGDAYVPGP